MRGREISMKEEIVPPSERKRKFRVFANPRVFPYSLLVPVLIFFVIWNVLPLLWMVGLSFYKYDIVSGDPVKFAGMANFIGIFNNNELWQSLSKTFLFVVLGVGIQTLLGLALGYLFWGSAKLPGRKLALTLLFSPMILTPVAAGTFFKLIYDPVFGVANYYIQQLFGVKIDFLGDAKWAYPAVLTVDIWMWTPFMILMTLAALGSVPKAELEAAEIDRLPWMKRVWYIMLPHGKFILMLGILLRTIDSFKTMDLVYTMTSGGPGNATDLIAISLFRRAFEAFSMGNASALALITLLVAIAFTSIYLYILKSKERRA
ncbi:carbohydrate ABC transporter permease [Paenibacillus sp. CECT 9249]|uniref:carbohydrate ABC transporter permease n=1 Tax=unclassified Paenibacillus TaxID=185978 RepID=UPI001C10C7A0|nr:sugar ABC transporter permease [Paenibacillus sp. CECT 9249]MBU5444180.1 sugar ABC transporter permease [Paenibacillus sp. MSJ-34]CAH0122542.1 Lactose transport system permease protein LacF [Paenibacillus sp. CECT 9249]